jgi:hypothetical protein
MHGSDRNRLKKRQQALLLGAIDMNHAHAAASALDAEADEVNVMRALETAIAVSYARAFTNSSLLRLDAEDFAPADPDARRLHEYLLELRDTVYAHTDKNSGRTATIDVISATGLGNLGGLPVSFGTEVWEEWLPLPREWIPAMQSLFREQQNRLREEAAAIQLQLDADAPPSG